MLIWLPLLAFILLYRLLGCTPRAADGGRNPHAFVEACLASGVILWAITEVLSLVNGLTTAGVAVAWGLVCGGLFWRLRQRSSVSAAGENNAIAVSQEADDGMAAWSRWAIASGLIILAVLGLAGGYFYPPNSPDAVEYHFPRALHHMQNQNVAHYPTHILRQVQFPPWSEYALVHSQLLGGGWHRLAGAVQWVAWVLLFGVAASLARALGASRAGQWFAAVLVATTPMAILQASTIGNDVIVALWVACLCYAILHYARAPNWRNALMLGAGFGLALCTKGTVLVLCFPLVVWVAGLLVQDVRRLVPIGAAVAVALLISASYWGRNLDTFGDPLGQVNSGPRQYGYANDIHTPAALASNLVRNLGIHARVNFSPRLHPHFLRARTAFHAWIGLHENDQRTTWLASIPRAFSWDDWDDERTGNPLQLLLFLTASIGAIGLWRTYGQRDTALFTALIFSMFVFFCLVLKYQTHNARLQLPMFILAAPLTGAVLFSRRRGAAQGLFILLSIVLMGLALPVLGHNTKRPLIGTKYPWQRTELARVHVRDPKFVREYVKVWQTAAAEVSERKMRQVGLVCGDGGDEYFLWAGLQQANAADVRVVHVLVGNPTRKQSTEAMVLSRSDGILMVLPQGKARSLDGYEEVWRSALQSDVLVLLRRLPPRWPWQAH
jgi:hypothetical protein